MNKVDKMDFLKLINALGELFSKELSEAKIDMYYNALSDVPFSVISKNANVHVKVSRFMPLPADLRQDWMPQRIQEELPDLSEEHRLRNKERIRLLIENIG